MARINRFYELKTALFKAEGAEGAKSDYDEQIRWIYSRLMDYDGIENCAIMRYGVTVYYRTNVIDTVAKVDALDAHVGEVLVQAGNTFEHDIFPYLDRSRDGKPLVDTAASTDF